MAEPNANSSPAGWQVTATTIYCDEVDEYVTIMVYKDWSSKCTWGAKYKDAVGSIAGRKLPGKIKNKIGKCHGAGCKNITDYRDKLKKEEAAV